MNETARNSGRFYIFGYTETMSKRIHVIIVDDDMDNRDFTIENFVKISWIESIRIVEDASELLHYLDSLHISSEYPSLIIIDYMLRRINGEELLNLLRNHPKYHHIQVAFYSSNLSRDIRARLEQLDVQFFERPLSGQAAEELAVRIKNVALKHEN